MSTDAIVLLKNDHKTVEKLFKDFEKAGADAHETKRKIVDSIIEELTVHAYLEEKIFYPEAREAAPDTSDHVLESVEEHHVVVWMLSELAGVDPEGERFDAKVTTLLIIRIVRLPPTSADTTRLSSTQNLLGLILLDHTCTSTAPLQQPCAVVGVARGLCRLVGVVDLLVVFHDPGCCGPGPEDSGEPVCRDPGHLG